MSLDMTPVHRNLHTKVTFLGLEFEDLILVLALAAAMNLLAHFVNGNQPALPQQIPAASSSTAPEFSLGRGSPTLEGHAEQIRSSIGEVMGTQNGGDEGPGTLTVPSESSSNILTQPNAAGATSRVVTRSTAAVKRGPSVHRYNLGTWTAYHAARIAAGSIAGAASRGTEKE